jgi:hypothetical protein
MAETDSRTPRSLIGQSPNPERREPWSDNLNAIRRALNAIRRALEDAGVEFIPARSGKGVGVRLRKA